jgi:hypothetical protein
MEILFGGAGADVVRQAEMGQVGEKQEKQEIELEATPESN